ncbi:hypothetical protein CLOACE_10050 [Clostridium acetireducens DSM 10703]|jgi:hypothetical protein|uniref:Uncharacterized protein n=1 Tax=Clostridium acetireducens DSM 10703 TaxID=1121290 RepID=A0A1E8EZQ5_9CLOT|nr:hypothetical protein [Clostridium acetireducens]OFI06505.1 hypothetical protein CLOACE_10050 [Clostridium acetireducens DSM 10703]
MEFKLNKIDTEIRQRIQDVSKDGKIHRKAKIKIDKDNQKNKNSSGEKFSDLLEKNKSKQKIVVTAVKTETVKVDAFIEKDEKKDVKSGTFIDTKR